MGCHLAAKWAGLGCSWERGWGDKVAVPTLPGPVLEEHSGEVSCVTDTLALQDFQFLRGIKAPRSPGWCAAWNHAVPKKTCLIFRGTNNSQGLIQGQMGQGR